MERLTKKVDGVWTALCEYGSSPYPVVTQEVIDRLAAYEDTGLTPEEVQIQKEAMERMGWFGKMFQRYKGDPRGPIGTLGGILGKSVILFQLEEVRKREPIKDIGGNIWLPLLLDEFQTMAEVIEKGMDWIPVEERLPGVSGNYICAVNDKHGSVWTIPAEWSLEMKTWFGAFGEIKNKVTHWTPLPEAPKEEKE